MSMNEQICEKLGLQIGSNISSDDIVISDVCYRTEYGEADFRTDPRLADLLENKMVEDGWRITVYHWMEKLPDFPAKIYFSITAADSDNVKFWADGNTRPLAICELFTKVYDIKFEETK
jgi:hypothetical protein